LGAHSHLLDTKPTNTIPNAAIVARRLPINKNPFHSPAAT
jgi:hypothetical protein